MERTRRQKHSSKNMKPAATNQVEASEISLMQKKTFARIPASLTEPQAGQEAHSLTHSLKETPDSFAQ